MGMCLQSEIPGGVRAASLRRFAKDERGSELFEAALVLPLLFMVLIGIVWMGRAITVYQALGRAAREGARVALAPTCATCGDATAGDTVVEEVVENSLTAASLDVGNPGFQVQVNRNQPLNPGDPSNYRFSGVSVTVTYPVQLVIPFTSLNGSTINITSTVSMRQEF